jgi:hypothetical protein
MELYRDKQEYLKDLKMLPISIYSNSPGSFKTEQDDSLYKQVVDSILHKALPFELLKELTQDSSSHALKSLLPLFKWSAFEKPPFNLAFYLVSRSRNGVFKFFYDMVSRWLIPGKQIFVGSFFAADFVFSSKNEEVFTACELVLEVLEQDELDVLMRNLPSIESELILGAESSFQANRILEVKGVSSDVKTSMVQEHIVSFLQRRPDDLGPDIFTEMQHFLVTCKKEFKDLREYRHMSRIIVVHYLFRKSLKEEIKKNNRKRYLYLKFLKTSLHKNQVGRNVLAVIVGVNFIRENEVFEERHLLKAIQNYLPESNSVEGSFFCHTDENQICNMYLEIEKSDASTFSISEVRRLKKELPGDLKDRIEHLMHPIFMPRNEEEIMRNILTLSNQLRFVRDLPQVIVSFDEQTDQKISFTVILLRILKPNLLSIAESFEKKQGTLEFVSDQVKVVGCVRKKYSKEANVFSLKTDKTMFLRADHSLDLYQARQFIVGELQDVVGEVRDYNGGLISKQNELLSVLKESLGDKGKQSLFILENFFYALTPSVMRSVLDPISLKTLFLMTLEVLENRLLDEKLFSLEVKSEKEFVYVSLVTEKVSLIKVLREELVSAYLQTMNLAFTCLGVEDVSCLSLVYRCRNSQEKDGFIELLYRTIDSWKS